jgi:hypothetical protein
MKIWNSIFGIAMLSAIAVAAQGQDLYNNTNTPIPTLGNQYVLNFSNGQEIGDQIYLANYLTDPYLTGFSFIYSSTNSIFSGPVMADVRFYLNNGVPTNGYSTPGTLFYDTGAFGIQAPEYYYGPLTNTAILTFDQSDLYTNASMNMNPSMQMPSNFTVSVSFSGLAGSDQVGLNDFEPPTVGTNYGDYWFNTGTGWELLTNSVPGVAVGFGLVFTATTEPVPEPATLCLAVVGAALLLVVTRRRRLFSLRRQPVECVAVGAGQVHHIEPVGKQRRVGDGGPLHRCAETERLL